MTGDAVSDFIGRLSDAHSEDTEEVGRAYRRKVDPEEPWRYVCPDCGSPSVKLLVGGKSGYGKTYKSTKAGKDVEKDREAKYRCKPCGERKQRVYDKKTGGMVKA